ncbi:MAG: hypothetical protein ACOVNY_03755 [Chitinophagaceae bacterium]
MKTKLLFAVTAIFCVCIFSGCKKSATASGSNNKISIITSKSWKITLFTASSNNVVVVDRLQGRPACELDNIIKFATNETFAVEEGATKCNTTDPNIYDTGTWKLESNETKFNFDGQLLDIVEISSSIIKLRGVEVYLGVPLTVDIVFQP